MFADLDASMKAVLDDPAAPAELRSADVSFETPDRNYDPAVPTVNLFLYEVKENRARRDPTPLIERVGDSFVRRMPPERVDCVYVVTTWAHNLIGAARVAAEHLLLAQALAWLGRFPELAAEHLQGGLVSQLYPVPVEVARNESDRNGAHFWSALGTIPRPSFYVSATLAVDLGLSFEGPLVTTRLTGVQGETWAQVGGRVRTSGGTGVAGALVEVVDAGLRARSDVDGRWSIVRVPIGTHDLRVVAAGFEPKSQPLVVPALPADYDVELVPL